MNALLIEGMSMPSARSRHFWATETSLAETVPKTIWAQEYYSFDGFVLYPQAFGDGGALVHLLPERDYYARRGNSADSELEIPASLSDDLLRFGALPPELRRRMLRSGHWRTAARELWNTHMSSWYVAQVAALETLAYSAPPPDPCSACGKDQNPGPTARFKNFLDAYAPSAGTRTETAALYTVRSGLVHGTALLEHDGPFGMPLLPATMDELGQMDQLVSAVSIATINWLRAQTGAVGAASLGPSGPGR